MFIGECIEVAFHGPGDFGGNIGSRGGKRWDEPRIGTNDIGDDGNFAIAIALAATDADGGNCKMVRQMAGGGRENAFEDKGGDSCFL